MPATFLASTTVTQYRNGNAWISEPSPSGPSSAPAARKPSTGLSPKRRTMGTTMPAVPAHERVAIGIDVELRRHSFSLRLSMCSLYWIKWGVHVQVRGGMRKLVAMALGSGFKSVRRSKADVGRPI